MSPSFLTPAALPSDVRPHLCVVVDTEEEFDWTAPLTREAVDTSAIADTWRLQDVLRPYGLKPTYVIDYPVATTQASADTLAEIARRGECQIGAHVHPWVNPPYTEPVTPPNSYGCNLGEDLERSKIRVLTEAIGEHLGCQARIFKAGRYGFGATTARILEDLDYHVDLSVNPHMDFRGDGGPVFYGIDPVPATFGVRRRLLELPCTTAFIGLARRAGEALHRAASSRWLAPLRAVGVLSKSGVLNKVMLSPEGNTLDEMTRLSDALLADGVRVFSLTFHSPSLKPGCTPYVRTAADRDALLRTIDRYCDYFLGRLNGVASTPDDLYRQLCKG